MAGTTTYYGISYPTSTDYVKDGATAMQTIATGFDSAVAIPTYNNQTGTTYTFVIGDTGKTVTASNASASTYTIPPQSSVAWASGATLTVRNLGAGVVTFAGGVGVTVTNTAATLAQYTSAKLIRTASDAWTVVPEGSSGSGLTLISSTTIGSVVSSVTVSNCFSATYKNYRVVVSNSDASADNYICVKFNNSTGSTYKHSGIRLNYSGTTPNYSYSTADTYIVLGTTGQTNDTSVAFDVLNPFGTDYTVVNCSSSGTNTAGTFNGLDANAASQTGLVFLPGSGTLTGGTIKVYGYKD